MSLSSTYSDRPLWLTLTLDLLLMPLGVAAAARLMPPNQWKDAVLIGVLAVNIVVWAGLFLVGLVNLILDALTPMAARVLDPVGPFAGDVRQNAISRPIALAAEFKEPEQAELELVGSET